MANCVAVQQQIDNLRTNLAKAKDASLLAENTEKQQVNLLIRKKTWYEFLQKIFTQLNKTDQLALNYADLTGRAATQAYKVAGNSYRSLKGNNILLCELREISDCIEVLRTFTDELKKRISASVKDGTILGDCNSLYTAVDEALKAVKEAVKAFLNVYQLQEDIYTSLDGSDKDDRGINMQLKWMKDQVLHGYSADPDLSVTEDCKYCDKQATLFPMEKSPSGFYKLIKGKLTELPGEIQTQITAANSATSEKEIKQAKRDALQAALNAAEAANACDTKK